VRGARRRRRPVRRRPPARSRQPLCAAFEGLVDRYAEGDPARAERKAPGWLSHEALLLDSPFAHLERHAVIERRPTPVESPVDRALSGVSEERPGPRSADLAGEVRAVMAGFASDGVVTEVFESQALIARRHPT